MKCLRRGLWLATLLGGVVHAQVFDSGLPDASLGTGGAEQTSEENEQAGPCTDTRDCDRSFACVEQRCVPVKTKSISGCGGSAMGALALVALGVLVERRGRVSGRR